MLNKKLTDEELSQVTGGRFSPDCPVIGIPDPSDVVIPVTVPDGVRIAEPVHRNPFTVVSGAEAYLDDNVAVLVKHAK